MNIQVDDISEEDANSVFTVTRKVHLNKLTQRPDLKFSFAQAATIFFAASMLSGLSP